LASSIGYSSEVNSSVSINNIPTESEGDLADLLDEISYKVKIKGVLDLPLQDGGSMDNIDFNVSNNFDFEEDFADLYGGVSNGSENEWLSGLALQDDNPIITSLELDNNNIVHHQVYAVIILTTSEDLDSSRATNRSSFCS
jgi:hypothetical protein